ncbi:MAG: mycofactocin system glycosyltransferase [Actinomycetota bacterium]
MVRNSVSNVSFIPDDQWFRSEDGTGLLAGSPLTYFTVTEAGARVINAIENNEQLPANHDALTKRLLAVGAIHPKYETAIESSEFTVVIPAFLRDNTAQERLQSLVDSLSGPRIIIVDDCSPTAFSIAGAEVLRLSENAGPAAARNAGLAITTTPYIAFVDDDSVVTAEQLSQLASHFIDESVSVVAPRVASVVGESLIAEYESLHSPLDLGVLPAVVRPLSRVSYVPAAVLLARTSVLKEHHGFNASMRLGEDVDLVWRLVENGHSVRYDPSVVCHHTPRSTLGSLLRQRWGYGRSAASLDKQHKFTASPLRANIVMLIPAVTLLMGYLFATLALVPLMLLWFQFTLRRTGLKVGTRSKLTLTGWFATVRLLASAVMRAWWPPILLIGQYSLRIGAVFVFSALVPAMYGLMRKKPLHTFGYLALRVLDPMAYGVGVWSGVLRERSIRCLLPVVTRGAIRLRSKA